MGRLTGGEQQAQGRGPRTSVVEATQHLLLMMRHAVGGDIVVAVAVVGDENGAGGQSRHAGAKPDKAARTSAAGSQHRPASPSVAAIRGAPVFDFEVWGDP